VAATDDVVTIQSGGLTTATTAYTSGDVVGNVFTSSAFAAAAAGTGIITAVSMVDVGDVMGAATLYGYTATLTGGGNNNAFAPSDAEQLTMIPNGRIDLPPTDDLGANRQSSTPCWVPYKCGGGSTSLFFILVTRTGNAVFTAVTDISLILAITKTS
jgi:hypothetical protein